MDDAGAVLIEAAAVRDAAGVSRRPGRVLQRAGRIVATGGTDLTAPPDARRIRRPGALLLPALVNAHAHLDLTAVGPRPFRGSFLGWIEEVIPARLRDAGAITASVHDGLRLARDAGTGWLGDITGTDAAARARATAPPELRLPGVAWLECFGVGRDATAGAARAAARLAAVQAELGAVASAHGLRIDLQPHAPYSAGLPVFERAAALGAPATHLAESPEEAEFVATASGPFAALLRRLELWDDSIRGHGASPIAAWAPALARAPFVLAHVNYASDADLELLAALPRGVAVAYCPVASDYFGHRDHRYREMLARGITVCLGTDSILCQPPDAAQPLGILAQMRHLHRRDGTDPDLLLRMATVHGARALRLADGAATLAPGAPARLATVSIDPADPTDPLLQALRGDAPLTPVGDG